MFPPEINSGLMYSGAGVGPLTEAAQAWSTLSSELYSAALEYGSVITSLATTWRGPSSLAMQTAARPYLAWLQTSAAQAEATATQATAAAGAYSAAHAATVPPPVIVANRAQLTTLIVTNLLGQNTPAIAANEAQYAEMWAQDAAAMNAYSASSQATTSALPQFNPAPQVATGAQATDPILQFIETLVPGFIPGAGLQNLAYLITSPLGLAFVSSGFFTASDAIGIFAAFLGLVSIGTATQAEGMAAQAMEAAHSASNAVASTAPVEARVMAAAGVSNSSGRGMSVPPSWARPAEQQQPAPINTEPTTRDRYQAAIPALPFMPVTGLRSNQGKVRTDPEYGHVSRVTPPKHPHPSAG